jgi:hypothetical protein
LDALGDDAAGHPQAQLGLAAKKVIDGNSAVSIVLPQHELDLGFLVGSEIRSHRSPGSYRASHAHRSIFEALTAVSAIMVAQTMSLIMARNYHDLTCDTQHLLKGV